MGETTDTVRCRMPGTFLVRDEAQPIPVGKTKADVSVVVHHYPFGWVCTVCRPAIWTTRPECKHIAKAKATRS